MVREPLYGESEENSFSLYLHTPFCRKKCPYCDFFSVEATPDKIDDYPNLLLQELDQAADDWRGPLTSIFFGGGTPSLLPAASIATIIERARSIFGVGKSIEISLEANPGTVNPGYLSDLRHAGINRLSLGIQALSDAELNRLGRIHTHQESLEAVSAARHAGFTNLSLDFIYSRPEQDLAQLRAEITELVSLGAQHLSCYGLTVEEGTPFAQLQEKGTLTLPDEEAAANAYRVVHEELSRAGFRHYEISNFAKPGFECEHNLGYWQRRPYLGLGPGAHSLQGGGFGERLSVPPDLDLYRQRLAAGQTTAESIERCDQRLAMAETLYLGLRTAAGVSDADFFRRFSTTIAELFPAAIASCGKPLHHDNGRWALDLDGWLLYDHLIAHFL